MSAYYNDNDAFCARWLRNLTATRVLPGGTVDDRSILDISPGDLAGYDQIHLFAGIGGWPYALDLAGWPADRDVWTASCPCQPLSSAGLRAGHADERHLWPAVYRLIAERRPATIFGEQVASALGREWLAGVRADLEHLGYAVGCADLSAASVGAPHIRQRLYWVAIAGHDDRAAWSARRERQPETPSGQRPGSGSAAGRVGDAETARQPLGGGFAEVDGSPARQGSLEAGAELGGLGDADRDRRRSGGQPQHAGEPGAPGPLAHRPGASGRGYGSDGGWDGAVWLQCADGKARRVEPGIQPLAYGVSNRVGRLRAYGNAIVPQAAAAFIAAYLELSK